MELHLTLVEALTGGTITRVQDMREEDGWIVLTLDTGRTVHLCIDTDARAVIVHDHYPH